MKKILLLVIAILSIAGLNAQTVHTTKTGAKYHSAGCSYLKSDIPMDLGDAVKKGLTPCSRCNPPQSGQASPTNTNTNSNSPVSNTNVNTPVKTNGTSVQCSATTKAGDRCSRTTTSANGKCWQHGGQ